MNLDDNHLYFFLHTMTKAQYYLVVSTHLKNMLVNLDHFPKFGVNIEKC